MIFSFGGEIRHFMLYFAINVSSLSAARSQVKADLHFRPFSYSFFSSSWCSTQFFYFSIYSFYKSVAIMASVDQTLFQSQISDSRKVEFLTPQGQLSLQGTFFVWMDVKILWTKADDWEAGMLDAEFYSLSNGVILFWKFFQRARVSIIKNVPSTDNCPWQVTLRAFFIFDPNDSIIWPLWPLSNFIFEFDPFRSLRRHL